MRTMSASPKPAGALGRIRREPRMTSTTVDAVGSGLLAAQTAGPLEQRHLQYANYRAVADGSKVTRTHWHIALANGLGWGFDCHLCADLAADHQGVCAFGLVAVSAHGSAKERYRRPTPYG